MRIWPDTFISKTGKQLLKKQGLVYINPQQKTKNSDCKADSKNLMVYNQEAQGNMMLFYRELIGQ